MDRNADEVTYSDYRKACGRIAEIGAMMATADPDEAAEHWLPELTAQIAIAFSFVGDNMTARLVPTYHETLARYEAAKDRREPADAGTLDTSDTGGK